MDDDTDNSRQSSNSTAIAAVMVALPLLYAFGIGPTVFMFSKYPALQPMEDAATAFYAPVFWLDEHTALNKPIEIYLGWWARLVSK